MEAMNSIDDILQVIHIGLTVAVFLLNTGCSFKAIDVCKECLNVLAVEVLENENQIFNFLSIAVYKTLFKAYFLVTDYTNTEKCCLKLLDIYRELEYGESSEGGILVLTLANIYEQQFKYEEARELYKRAIKIMRETGDKKREAYAYAKFGNMSYFLGECDKAKEYLKKALPMTIEIADRNGEAGCYGILGSLSKSLGKYVKAKEYFEKALAIKIQIGDRKEEAICYGNLGTLLRSVGEYDKAKAYLEKALAINKEIGDKAGEAVCYGNLGTLFQSLGEYEKAEEYLENALVTKIEIGDRKGEAADYGNLGTISLYLGDYDKAKEYIEKALVVRIEIGDKQGEAVDNGNLGKVFLSLGEWDKAEDYLEKALSITQEIRDLDKEIGSLCGLTMVKLSQGKIQEAFDLMLLAMDKSESLRTFLRDNDEFKISFLDANDDPYTSLSFMLCLLGNSNNALYVLELARARALADLMKTQYSVELHISANPMTWFGIENIMTKESDSTCLYISYFAQFVFLWILKTSGVIHFRTITVDENIFVGTGLLGSLEEFFAKGFRNFGILLGEECEDRSLSAIGPDLKSREEEGLAAASLRSEGDDDESSKNVQSSLSLYHRMLIGPVADFLKDREIIIVPDRFLNQVPLAALTDGDGKCLSETFRIRIVLSLTTLKLLQDSPANHHNQTGALIVGDPDVGRVRYKGRKTTLSRLPCARNEVAMIGRLLGVQPLIGQYATKQAVLEKLHSVGLVHFAAHGNAERGEIALSPIRSANRIPKEEDYLLTIPDVAKVQLRAKLVVLSCCHSARGQIKTEGVIGIARAFLGSGARSVLVALWAISDVATEQLMCRFYEHLVRGESASESLHRTMKWMRDNGFAKVSNWAPFLLIGDDVTFEFGNQE